MAVRKTTAPRATTPRATPASATATPAAPTAATPKATTKRSLVPKKRTDAELDALEPRPAIPAGLRLGAHVSSSGGTVEAPPRAAAIGATAFQLFTKQANQWAEREVGADEAARFADACAAAGSPIVISHDSYLINLASPDPVLREKSIASFAAELRRCAALGVHYLVSHPGNYMDDREAGLARNADGIAQAFAGIDDGAILCLESTAGQGTVLGRSFEELAAIIAQLPAALQPRVGVCLDTAHLWAAGYDLVGDYDGVIAQLDRALGVSRVKVWHLNDSKAPFGSRKDRHELIGEGTIGAAPFARIMSDPRFAAVPKVLETPKGDDAETSDRRMLNRLLGYLAA
ncbi:MAG: deoxyribonuclease IV [Gemmatimonadaceae bacterium]|nr:deoxyribonuclease IV [Gemmatimonadaceae bacterium]